MRLAGFNPSLMASEEPELTARLRNRGWEIWRLDAPMTEHDARIFTFRPVVEADDPFGIWLCAGVAQHEAPAGTRQWQAAEERAAVGRRSAAGRPAARACRPSAPRCFC